MTLLRAVAAEARCDVVANAAHLADARAAIDAACPCAAAASASLHGKCAKPVVNARVDAGTLVKTCRSEALNHAKKSTCGRPGAVVCCRVKTTGKTLHKIAKSADKCTSSASTTACVSAPTSIDTGCDANGCVVLPVCGNGVVESGETCDPPIAAICDADCQPVTCEPPVTSCGNGTLDAGEACEPPGAAACTWECQAAPCAAAGPGEIDVACVAGNADVGAGGRATDYLLAWTGLAHRPDADVIGRRFDVDGDPLDPAAHVVSAGVPCGGAETVPSVAGNADGYLLSWKGAGPATEAIGLFYAAIYARPYDAAASLGPLEELARKTPFGMCTSTVGGPGAVAPIPLAGPATFAVLWQDYAACVGGFVFEDPTGALLDYTGGGPARTNVAIGYPLAPPPTLASESGATIASLAGDTLAAWYASALNPTPPSVSDPFVSGAWLTAGGTSTSFSISSRLPGAGTLRPAVAAATDRFLVAWAQGAIDPTEIRAMRVTHAGGPLDPDGGILLATTAGGTVTGGPVAAFDGGVWLVAWSEDAGGTSDLRAVAVGLDGTVLDATPRLLASGVADDDPAIASAGDGRSLVVYVKPDAGMSAVRARLVPGT